MLLVYWKNIHSYSSVSPKCKSYNHIGGESLVHGVSWGMPMYCSDLFSSGMVVE
jgi:hypothetical protein